MLERRNLTSGRVKTRKSLILVKATGFVIKWGIGHIWAGARKWLWPGSIIVTGAAVVNNYQVWKEMEGRND